MNKIRAGIVFRDIVLHFLIETTRINPFVLQWLPGGRIIQKMTFIEQNSIRESSGEVTIHMTIMSLLSALHALLISLPFMLIGLPLQYLLLFALAVFMVMMCVTQAMLIQLPHGANRINSETDISVSYLYSGISIHDVVSAIGHNATLSVYGVLIRLNGQKQWPDSVLPELEKTAVTIFRRLDALKIERLRSQNIDHRINGVIKNNRMRHTEELNDSYHMQAVNSPEFIGLMQQIHSFNTKV